MSKELESFENIMKVYGDTNSLEGTYNDFLTIKKALQRLDKYEQILGSGRLTHWNYKNTTLPLESCKPYLRLGQLEDIYFENFIKETKEEFINCVSKELEIPKELFNEPKPSDTIENANHSKAMRCLNKIVESFNETTTGMYGLGEVVVANDLIYSFKKELDTIQQALLKSQEQEKVLRIIKEKCIGNHNLGIVTSSDNYSVYCAWFTNTYGVGSPIEQYKLTKEEFELLKEVVK